jgi:D-alanyl-lipoteichoic acid acyltransferase DltB (MBOAT superfamily)
MLFNSATFIIFFVLVLALYYGVTNWTARKSILLFSSYLFYAAWNPPFVALLWLSTLIDWFSAKGIHNSKKRVSKVLLLILSLSVNLGLLAFFKYSGFAIESFAILLQQVGVNFSPAAPDIILPMGISFYTFQTLSYTIDVYRGKDTPAKSFLDYALYVTFFPQLVAGPIVRSKEFLPQCQDAKRWNGDLVGYGIALMTIGLFQKIVLADGLMAPVVEQVYDQISKPSFVAAWTGTLAFTAQIFFDFAGYSTCAIGAAMCLGFALPKNFASPYGAIGFSDFWQRWHITLSSWLRDYLYIPLGGNRSSSSRTLVNLMLTMLIGGLWHGAAWTFVFWGGLHGTYLIAERVLVRSYGHLPFWKGAIPQIFLLLATFFAVCIAWVFFRATTFAQAATFITAMTIPRVSGSNIDKKSILVTFVVVLVLLVTHALTRKTQIQERLTQIPSWALAPSLGAMIYLCLTMPGQDRAFIYFQF